MVQRISIDMCHVLQLSWVLHVDVLCTNYDGNMADAALLAALAALRNSESLMLYHATVSPLASIAATLPKVMLP